MRYVFPEIATDNLLVVSNVISPNKMILTKNIDIKKSIWLEYVVLRNIKCVTI